MGKERIKCTECDLTFRDRFNLWRHQDRKHRIESKSAVNKPKKGKPRPKCLKCGLTFFKNGNLKRHANFCPKKKQSSGEEHVFSSLQEFNEWKKDIESKTKSVFVRKSNYKLKNGSQRIKFCCNRSGYFKPSGNNKRKKVAGSNKINAICPARIVSIFSDNGSVNVTFYPTHQGHTSDKARIDPPDKINEAIYSVEEIAVQGYQDLDDNLIIPKNVVDHVKPTLCISLNEIIQKNNHPFTNQGSARDTSEPPNKFIIEEVAITEDNLDSGANNPSTVPREEDNVNEVEQLKEELRKEFEEVLHSIKNRAQAYSAKEWISKFHSFIHSRGLAVPKKPFKVKKVN